jgi:HK97 family phage prohead protease
VPFNQLSSDLGKWVEMIEPGAFNVAGDIRALWQHDSSYVLGRTTAGTLEIEEQSDGIHVQIDPPETTWARDAMVSMERRDVSGFSFGFIVRRDNWKGNIRHVLEADLLEVSVVSFPAYETTAEVLRRAAELAAAEQPPVNDTTGPDPAGAGDGDDKAIDDEARARRVAAMGMYFDFATEV